MDKGYLREKIRVIKYHYGASP